MPLFDSTRDPTLAATVNALAQRVTALEQTPTWVNLTPTAKWDIVTQPKVSKRNEVVYFRGEIKEKAALSISLYDTVFILPEGYRPAENVIGLISDQTAFHDGRLDVLSTGEVKIWWDSGRGYPGVSTTSFIWLALGQTSFPTW